MRSALLAGGIVLALASHARGADLRVLAGAETSKRYGESGVGAMAVADAHAGMWWAEAQGSTIDKYTAQGWRVGGSAGVSTGVLLAGLGYTHRNGGPWAKDTVWARLGITHGWLAALARVAPESVNRELLVEVRARGQIRRMEVEARAWVGDHAQAEGGYAYGVQLLAGWAHVAR